MSEIHFQRVFSHMKYGFTLGKLVYSAAARRATACPQATLMTQAATPAARFPKSPRQTGVVDADARAN